MGSSVDMRRLAKLTASLVLVGGAVAFALVSTDELRLPAFPLPSLAAFALALVANVFLAGLRFETIANRQGASIGIMAALQANAAAALASQVMLNFMGQAAGRAAVLHRSGMSASLTVSLSLLERIVAALTLGLAALFAALFLFGRLTSGTAIDPDYFFRVLAGLALALLLTLGTVYRGFLPLAAREVFSRRAGGDLLALGGFSLLVHLAMLAAYVSLALGVGAEFGADLVAACLVIMFAASLPISFGGWGVRELSAGFALSLVGLSGVEGVAIGAAVGLGSLMVQLGFAALATGRVRVKEAAGEAERAGDARTRPDYARWLSLLTPVVASIALLFSLHVTVQGHAINLNLADAPALLGGMLFLAFWFERRRLPDWQVPRVNLTLLLITLLFAFAALHGYLAFGYSTWGVRNRLLGWFVLLAFLASGALFTHLLRPAGREILLKGFVVALGAVAAFEFAFRFAERSGLPLTAWSASHRFEGFSQNANAYAFLLLAGLAIILALLRKGQDRRWIVLGGLQLAALVFSASRAGWGGAAILFLAAIAIQRRLFRPSLGICLTAGLVTLLFLGGLHLVQVAPQLFPGGAAPGGQASVGQMAGAEFFRSSEAESYADSERMVTLRGGWELWKANPVFGAGLGAYVQSGAGGSETAFSIHNSFLWIAAETGLVGLALFAWAGLQVMASLLRRLRDPGDEAALALFLLLLCFAAMSMVHDLLYQRVLWFLMGACLAVPAVGERERAARPAP